MLTDAKLKGLKPRGEPYKVWDRDGLYAVVLPTGTITFRYDYRINGRTETFGIGRYGPDALSLADARQMHLEARRAVYVGKSPARAKSVGKRTLRITGTFSVFAEDWLQNAKKANGDEIAESTKDLRKAVLNREILPKFGKLRLEEIESSDLRALCNKIKEPPRNAPATALRAREIVQQVYRYAQKNGLKVKNPADDVEPNAIATFKPRDRALSPDEIRAFFTTLEDVGTLPTLKLGLKFVLLTMCRKGELLYATWPEVNFEAATWTIPASRMKADRAHVVYLSQQALDILIALKTCAGGGSYLLPGRYDTGTPTSEATLNRVITATVEKAQKDGKALEHFSVHDLRRTASTLLHEAGFNTDWIEKCLAHEQKGVRAVYNKAEYATQRRQMLQAWADMVDGWIAGAAVVPIGAKAA